MTQFGEYDWPGNIRELEYAVKKIVALGDERAALADLRARVAAQGHNGAAEIPSLKDAARAASRQAERELILKVLARTRWNRKRAAQELQISYKALLYKLKQIGLDDSAVS
jgi:two-component system response regulator AtoC